MSIKFNLINIFQKKLLLLFLELFSQYIFPGIHEYYLYTCDVHDDCGDNAEKHGIECEFINENYRVCQCKKDYLFNPIDSTCGK